MHHELLTLMVKDLAGCDRSLESLPTKADARSQLMGSIFII